MNQGFMQDGAPNRAGILEMAKRSQFRNGKGHLLVSHPPLDLWNQRLTGNFYQASGCACARLQASAAAKRREMEGCEWKNHSTHLDGVGSARFCSASLFIEDTNGSMVVMDSKA